MKNVSANSITLYLSKAGEADRMCFHNKTLYQLSQMVV